jgi:hypothetical protein
MATKWKTNFKDWVESGSKGHPQDHNAYIDLELLKWKPNGHQVEHNPFKLN